MTANGTSVQLPDKPPEMSHGKTQNNELFTRAMYHQNICNLFQFNKQKLPKFKIIQSIFYRSEDEIYYNPKSQHQKCFITNYYSASSLCDPKQNSPYHYPSTSPKMRRILRWSNLKWLPLIYKLNILTNEKDPALTHFHKYTTFTLPLICSTTP